MSLVRNGIISTSKIRLHRIRTGYPENPLSGAGYPAYQTNGQKGRWTDGRTDRWTDGQMDGQTDELTDGYPDQDRISGKPTIRRQISGIPNRRTDGRTDGPTDTTHARRT